MAELPPLETIVCEVIRTFEIQAPPVPVESMLQHPLPGMWSEVDIGKLSIGFLKVKSPYSPRMSLTRLLARHIIESDWGHARQLHVLATTDADIHACARMLVMPYTMISALSPATRTASAISSHFEVPVEDAELRLTELADYL
ncbi:MAG: hypothetical protein CL610_11630 [Anaerolineaceae bacterium]|nr:hypothetical protein [Anaerolineaceae bacterium]